MSALFKGESMERKRALVVIVVIAALFFGASSMLKPKPATDSTNPRFNAYVTYFRRQKGYTVEYSDFDTFADKVDEMYKPVGSLDPHPIMGNVFIKSVKLFTLGQEFSGGELEAMCTRASLDKPVTVYYDDEKDIIFFIGDAFSSRFFYAARAPDPTATYGYYTSFTIG